MRLVLFVTGLGKPQNASHGLPPLRKKIEALNLDNTVVWQFRWGNVQKIVEEIRKLKPTQIVCIGHSYGVSTILMIAKILDGEFRFDDIICVDGIWRAKEDSPQFKSLWTDEKLVVTSNIVNIYVIRQIESLFLKGQALEATGSNVMDDVQSKLNHIKIDRDPWIEATLLKILNV